MAMNKLVTSHRAPNQFAVTLYQTRAGKAPRFAVVYGQRHSDNLTYAQAAREFGECVMHAETCAGNIAGE
jgi:hypothetical protein